MRPPAMSTVASMSPWREVPQPEYVPSLYRASALCACCELSVAATAAMAGAFAGGTGAGGTGVLGTGAITAGVAGAGATAAAAAGGAVGADAESTTRGESLADPIAGGLDDGCDTRAPCLADVVLAGVTTVGWLSCGATGGCVPAPAGAPAPRDGVSDSRSVNGVAGRRSASSMANRCAAGRVRAYPAA
jgi:hypothetical protein